jgi:predicted alpha-1,6-mannanase (GH76 family)
LFLKTRLFIDIMFDHMGRRVFAFMTLIIGHTALGQNIYMDHAVEAARTLQRWYNETTGLYEITNWWNAANCITALADLTAIKPDMSIVTGHVWSNTFQNAQKYNTHQLRMHDCQDEECTSTVFPLMGERAKVRRRMTSSVNEVQVERTIPQGFTNAFFDDESWWALAWIKVFEVTQDHRYLTTAEQVFQDLRTQGTNATCGGVWWDRHKTANTAISNTLFISVAAQLASHVPHRRGFYLKYAIDYWRWFEDSGLINSDFQVNDGIDLETCQGDRGPIFSYNQGVIVGALCELYTLTSNATYVDIASKIATAAVTRMTDADGVFHEVYEPDLGPDLIQFKGVFARNLKELYKVTGDQLYKGFLETNADSIWQRARDTSTGILGGTWSGPFNETRATAASHSSGLDLLVAAAAVQ